MSKFFRFLSFRGGKPPGSNNSNLCSIKDHSIISTHSKLRDGCEDLKESIEHYNQRCQAAKQLKEKDELYRLEEEKYALLKLDSFQKLFLFVFTLDQILTNNLSARNFFHSRQKTSPRPKLV